MSAVWHVPLMLLKSHLLSSCDVGIPIIFLHGFLGTSQDWIPVCNELKNNFCIGIDLPGHGDSPFITSFYEELSSIAPKFHLVGYSMGGRLGLGFAHRYEKQIASLTLIGAHFGLQKKERPARLKQDAKWAQMLLERPIDEFLIQWYDQPIFHTLNRDQMRMMRQKQNPISLAKTLLYYSLGKQPLYTPRGHLLVGEWDQKFCELYAPYSPYILKQAGHAAHLQQPKQIAQLIQRFIS
jgi:2-succinyl-6-hydroxy-2,4-cyclohexadiene-1-carboxylate synthase